MKVKPYILLLFCLNNPTILAMDNNQKEQLSKSEDDASKDEDDDKYEIELMAFLFALYIICAPDSLCISEH